MKKDRLMKKILSGFLLSFIVMCSGLAQGVAVEGVVTDKSNGLTLPGVNVFIEGTQIGTVTNMDGYYTIEVSSADVTLVYSFIGMNTVKEVVNNRTSINVQLVPDSEQLDDVIVVAYGTTTKEAYTGSAEVIGNEVIEDRPVTSFEKALQGTTAGLQVTSSSGQPGSSATVRIRGIGSLNASSSPLYVVDGVPMAGALSDINPNDIESLTVLKDAAAASLYGSRAANGVIMVTTKRGKAGKTYISFDSQVGVSSRVGDGYALMNSAQIYQQSWEGLFNYGIYEDEMSLDEARTHANDNVEQLVGFNPFGVDNPIDGDGQIIDGLPVHTNTDWRDAVYKTGIIHNYNLGVSGGTENTKVYFSLGYFSDSGTTLGANFERYTAKMNMTHKVNDWIEAGITNHLSYSEANAPPGGTQSANPVRSAEVINAATPIYAEDGSYNWFNTAVKDFNPLGLEKLNIYEYKTKRAMANAYFNFSLPFSLNFRTTAGIDYSGNNGLQYMNKYHGDGAAVNGRSTRSSSDYYMWSISNVLSWKKQTGNSSIEILAAQEATGGESASLSASATDFAVPNQPDLVWGGTAGTPYSNSSGWTMASYLSQAKFNYAGKYNLSASIRTDGSSRFGKNERYGLFYSFGAGWTLTNEDWMPNKDWLNYLKLRASYGTSGNSSIGNYAPLFLYYGGANYAGYPGLTPGQLGNNDIHWEKNAAMNIGLDATVLRKLETSLEWYTRKSNDLLYGMPLSGSKGYPSITTNLASMKNSGIELTFSYNVINKSDWNYTVSTNVSKYVNEVLDLTTESLVSGTKLLEEGESLYQFYMREWAGVNPDNGTPMWYTNAEADDKSSSEEPNESYIDPLGSGRQVTSEYNDAERVRSGLAIPDFFGGLSNSLSYKNFNFDFYFYYSIGGEIYNGDYASSMHDGSQPGNNLAADATNAWTPNNRNTDVPRYIVNGSDNGHQTSTRFLEDASYLRLKNVSLTYSVPQNICQRLRMSNLRVSISGENLWTLSNFNGFDPEQAINGLTGNNIPGTKVFTFGLKMNL